MNGIGNAVRWIVLPLVLLGFMISNNLNQWRRGIELQRAVESQNAALALCQNESVTLQNHLVDLENGLSQHELTISQLKSRNAELVQANELLDREVASLTTELSKLAVINERSERQSKLVVPSDPGPAPLQSVSPEISAARVDLPNPPGWINQLLIILVGIVGLSCGLLFIVSKK